MDTTTNTINTLTISTTTATNTNNNNNDNYMKDSNDSITYHNQAIDKVKLMIQIIIK